MAHDQSVASTAIPVDAATRARLSEALEENSPEQASLVDSTASDVTRVPTEIFRRHRIYRVVYHGNHPVQFYSVWAPAGPASVMTGAPERFVAAARAEPVSLTSTESAIAYAELYFELTHGRNALEYLVCSVSDLVLIPEPDDNEKAAQARLTERFGALIAPPTAVPDPGGGWITTLWIVHQQELRRLQLSIGTDGSVRSKSSNVARNLPLVYGR
jgi:hypothetical protein